MPIAITLDNEPLRGLLPAEDAYLMSADAFIVADGITRDPLWPADFTGVEKRESLKHYPNPSGARMAADAACEAFIASANRGESPTEALLAANANVCALNRQHVPAPDYLANDFYACVAAGGTLRWGFLAWAVIGDCGITVIGADGSLKLRTPNTVATLDALLREKKMPPGFNWHKPEWRAFVRRDLRNKIDAEVGGVKAGYGALTGESEAESFLRSGSCKVETGDLIVTYSDGFTPYIENDGFAERTIGLSEQQVADLLSGIAHNRKERTAVVVRVP